MCIKQARGLSLLLACVAGISASSAQEVYKQPDRNCDAATLFSQVNTLLGRKEYAQAAKILDQLQACPNRSPLEAFQLGWLYGRARRFDTALKIFNTVPADVPDSLTHNYAIALSKFELSDYHGAIDTLMQNQSPDNKSANLLAVSYSKLGLYREAYQVLEKQLQKDSSDVSMYLNLVAVCANGGDFAKAADVAAQAKKLFPDSPDVFIVDGAANTLLGHLDQAYGDFSTGAHLAPDRADARFFMALTDYKQSKFSEAVALLQTALKQGIADSDLHYLLAECLLKVDPANSATALRELDRAIELNPDSVSARTLRGKLLLESAHPKEAMVDLESALHQDPDSRAALYNLARAYRALGKTSEAQALFRQLRDRTSDTLNEFGDKRLNEALDGQESQHP